MVAKAFLACNTESDLTSHTHTHTQAQVNKDKQIAESTAELRNHYYCSLCDKQYTKYTEYDNHLNSYDHHHRQVSFVPSLSLPLLPPSLPPSLPLLPLPPSLLPSF